jgi:DOPA 4,5-dioxygenase
MKITENESEEIKEYHFHVYWFINDTRTEQLALNLRAAILAQNEKQYFTAIPLDRVNSEPVGPHPIASYEVWVPQEYFARFYSWILLNRPRELSILLHPLTREEVRDHTERAVFLGDWRLPLKTAALSDLLPKVPAQYPHLNLGYSAPKSQPDMA